MVHVTLDAVVVSFPFLLCPFESCMSDRNLNINKTHSRHSQTIRSWLPLQRPSVKMASCLLAKEMPTLGGGKQRREWDPRFKLGGEKSYFFVNTLWPLLSPKEEKGTTTYCCVWAERLLHCLKIRERRGWSAWESVVGLWLSCDREQKRKTSNDSSCLATSPWIGSGPVPWSGVVLKAGDPDGPVLGSFQEGLQAFS